MKRLITLLLWIGALTGMVRCQDEYKNMTVGEFQLLLQNADVQLVDVRTAAEYAESHLDGAVNIDVKRADFVDTAIARLDKARPVAVYCRSGKRSVAAATLLVKQGYRVVNMLGGITAWEKAKKPIVKPEAKKPVETSRIEERKAEDMCRRCM